MGQAHVRLTEAQGTAWHELVAMVGMDQPEGAVQVKTDISQSQTDISQSKTDLTFLSLKLT